MKRDAIGSPIAKKTLIGQRVKKPDAPEKATGKTRYINDMVLPQMLIGKVLFAGRPHARIVRIDTSAAEALPGVHAVLTGKDAAGLKFGFVRDNVALKDKVRCEHDEIAAVAAETEEIAAPRARTDRGRVPGPARRLHTRSRRRGRRAAGPRELPRQQEPSFRVQARRSRRGRSGLRPGRRQRVPSAPRHALLHGHVLRDRRLRPQRQADDLDADPVSVQLQDGPGAGAGHRSRRHPCHPAARRRRLRLQARRLPLRADRRAAGQEDRPAGQGHLFARGGVQGLADAPGGDHPHAHRLHPRWRAHLPHRRRAAGQRRLHLLGADHPGHHDAHHLGPLSRAGGRLQGAGDLHEQPVRRLLPRLRQCPDHVRHRTADGHAGRHGGHRPARVPSQERAEVRRSHAAEVLPARVRARGVPGDRRQGQRLQPQAQGVRGAARRARPLQEGHRPRLVDPQRRRRQDPQVRRHRHHPQGGRLRARHGHHRRLRNRPGHRRGHHADRRRRAGRAAGTRDHRQQRFRHRSVGRRRARIAHHLHRRQRNAPCRAQGEGADPGRRREDARRSRRRPRPARRLRRARCATARR